jgi:hypothetical protein
MAFNFLPSRWIQIQDLQGVASGSTAIINCPKGPRYRKILIGLQDTGVASTAAPGTTGIATGDCALILGSKQIHKYTLAQLDLLNTLNGSQYASFGVAGAANGGGITYLPIYFEEPWRKRADFQNGLALETGWLGANDVFQIKIPLIGTSPQLTVLALVDDYSSGKPNPIMKYYADDSNTNASTLNLSNLFQGNPPTDLVDTISRAKSRNRQ